MSGVSTLGLEPTGMLVVTTGMFSPTEGNLLGVNRDVTVLNVDCTIPSCIWGSCSKSLTVAILEPLGCLTTTCYSMMGLVGVVIMGTLASIVVLFVGPVPGAVEFCLWTLFPVWIEFHNSEGSMASACMSNVCEREMGLPFLSCQTKPSEEV